VSFLCGFVAGRRQRAHPGNSIHLKRVGRVSRILAYL